MDQLDSSDLAVEWLNRLQRKTLGSYFESGGLVFPVGAKGNRFIRLWVDPVRLANSVRDLVMDGSWTSARSPKGRLFATLDNYWEDALLQLDSDTKELEFVSDGTFRGFYPV